MAVLLMVKPLDNGTHPAILLAVALVGVTILAFGTTSFPLLVSEQQEKINGLRQHERIATEASNRNR